MTTLNRRLDPLWLYINCHDPTIPVSLQKVKYMKERVKMDMKRKRILEELNIITLAQDLQSTVGKEKVKQKSKQFQRPTTSEM